MDPSQTLTALGEFGTEAREEEQCVSLSVSGTRTTGT